MVITALLMRAIKGESLSQVIPLMPVILLVTVSHNEVVVFGRIFEKLEVSVSKPKKEYRMELIVDKYYPTE